MINVLFVSRYNSIRAPLAKAILNKMGRGAFYAESAGIEPKALDRGVSKILRESQLEIGDSNSYRFDAFSGVYFDYVIFLCDKVKESCAEIYLNAEETISWNFGEIPRGVSRKLALHRLQNELTTRIQLFILVNHDRVSPEVVKQAA